MSAARAKKREQQRGALNLVKVESLTDTQDRVFEEYNKGQHLSLHGFAGCGKTFLALYLALKSVEKEEQKRVLIFRSPVSGRDIGFLPGDVKEKMAVFEAPYEAIVGDLYGRGDAYGILKGNGVIDFQPTSFVRGTTIDDTVIILDEVSNCNLHEISSILTRVGMNTRIILAGDYRQSDLKYEDERNGIHVALKRLAKMKSLSSIEFTPEDCVRSDFVREWLMTEFD